MVTLKDVRDDLREALAKLQDGPVSWNKAVVAKAFIVKAIGDLQDLEAAESAVVTTRETKEA